MLTLDHLRNCPDPTDCGIKSLKGLTHLKDSTLKRQLRCPKYTVPPKEVFPQAQSPRHSETTIDVVLSE